MLRNAVSTSDVWPGVGPGEAPAFMRLVNARMVLKVWNSPTARYASGTRAARPANRGCSLPVISAKSRTIPPPISSARLRTRFCFALGTRLYQLMKNSTATRAASSRIGCMSGDLRR